MSYLLDKKIKRKKYIKYTLLVFCLILLICIRNFIFNGLAYGAHFIFQPVLVIGDKLSNKISNTKAYFSTKKSLFSENESLKSKIVEQEAQMINLTSLTQENIQLKEILGRKHESQEIILAGILAKPNVSIYDTILIDAGEKEGITIGKKVFAIGYDSIGGVYGNIPIGKIAEVYENSAKVVLFSSPGEKTEVVAPAGYPENDLVEMRKKNIFIEIEGRGGGNFEMILPRDFIIEKGTEILLPGIVQNVVAKVETITSDPRDSFQKALLTSPINIQDIKFVTIEK